VGLWVVGDSQGGEGGRPWRQANNSGGGLPVAASGLFRHRLEAIVVAMSHLKGKVQTSFFSFIGAVGGGAMR